MKALSKAEVAAHRYVIISPQRHTYYSGLIPRLMAGEIEVASLKIYSADFAEAKGFTFLQDWIHSIDPLENAVILASGQRVKYDLLSINVGGTPITMPSESPSNTIYLRPFDDFIPKWREIQRICSACVNPRFVVVGGGAAAVEVATALRRRLNRNQAPKSEVHLLSKSARLCESYTDSISAAILKSLIKHKINVHLNNPVEQIFSKYIFLKDGRKLEFDSIFIVTPTRTAEIVPQKIDSKLRLSSNIFAVGDCAEMLAKPDLPRSGVIAVREGQHLVQSIRNILSGQNPTAFSIPKNQLNILISGDRTARLVWGSFSFEGRWPLQLKNWIDERYIGKFKL